MRIYLWKQKDVSGSDFPVLAWLSQNSKPLVKGISLDSYIEKG